MALHVDTASRLPIYQQLAQQVREAIARGELAADAALPSVRQLSRDLVVNPNTVARAYRDLELAGLVVSLRGRGMFVQAPAAADDTTADVDALFSAARPPAVPRVPAKGHSAPTLALLHQVLRTAQEPLSAAQAAELTGVSRATAQRYLSYLVREGMVRLELRYGTTGRPEHRYRIAH